MSQPPVPQTWPIARHPAELGIDALTEGDTSVVRLDGELDLSQCPVVKRALEEAQAAPTRETLVDLEKLTFIDLTGIELLLVASRRSASSGRRLRFTRVTGNVARLFRLTGLNSLLPYAEPAPMTSHAPPKGVA